MLLRVAKNQEGIDPFLLLALLSLKVVKEQYVNLALMQTNREHLGDHWREVVLPLPSSVAGRKSVALPIQKYFEGLILVEGFHRDSFWGGFSSNYLLRTFGEFEVLRYEDAVGNPDPTWSDGNDFRYVRLLARKRSP